MAELSLNFDNPLIKRKRKKAASAEQAPDQESILGAIGRKALGGLAAVGNVLDLPGSSVRDLLGGQNPIDQWLTPTSDQNRLTGRDLLRKYNLVGQEDTWANWGAGFATELLLDPTTYLGVGALGKAAGAGLTGASKAAKAGSGLLRFNLPLATKGTELFTGPRSRALASFLGNAAEKYVGTSKPMRILNQVFDSSVMGRSTAAVQKTARGLFDAQGAAEAEVRGFTGNVARSLEQKGLTTPAAAKALRSELERPIASATAEEVAQGALRKTAVATTDEGMKLEARFADTLANAERSGLPADQLDDIVKDPVTGKYGLLGYAPRALDEKLVKGTRGRGGRQVFAGKDPADAARKSIFKGFWRGTEGVNDLFGNAQIKQKVTDWGTQIDQALVAGDKAAAKALKKQAVEEISQLIGTTYGKEIMPYMKVKSAGKATKIASRYRSLAAFSLKNPEWFDTVPFAKHVVADAESRLLSVENRVQSAHAMYDLISKVAAPPTSPGNLKETVSIGSVLWNPNRPGDAVGSLGFKKQAAIDNIAQRMGMSPKDVEALRVPKELADDMRGLWPGYTTPPETGSITKFVDSMQSMFKAGVLTWPSRYVRDVMSATARNIENGWADPISFTQAHNLIQGRTLSGLTESKPIRDWLANNKMPITDEAATEAVRQLVGQHFPGFHAGTDVLGTNTAPGLEQILERIPGRKPSNELESAVNVGKTFLGAAPGTTRNPLDVRGVYNMAGEARDASKFGPAAAGDMVGQYTDQMARIPPFLNLLKKGVDPAEAAAMINRAQVDYAARNYTPHERVLKRLFPFYSFTRAQVDYVAKELLTNPGGRLGAVIKASNRLRDPNQLTPDYVAETASIPLGTLPDGSQRYITGFGLMHEDPLSFLGGGVQGGILEAASRMNPLLKGTLEYGAGVSFFQKGPNGGRPADDLDPTIGRLISNVRGLDEPTQIPGGGLTEAVLANSPLSRALTTARQVTDRRKGAAAKAVNLLTGVRVADVSPGAQDTILREAVSQLLKQGGARTFSRTFVPEEVAKRMTPEEKQQTDQLQAILALLAERAKERKKAKELAKAK